MSLIQTILARNELIEAHCAETENSLREELAALRQRIKELERFYAKAQAQALRDAAEKFTFDCECGCPCDCYGPSTAKFQALRMADELERRA